MSRFAGWFLFGMAFLNCLPVCAQPAPDSAATDKLTKATNFSLPSSVAFNLLEVSPAQVHRPGFARDFKFDWLLKDSKIASNIALEAQPIWLFFYRNTDYQKLIRQNVFEKALSSLSLSVGTAARDSIRSLAWGAKINLYASKNPIYDTAYINRIGSFFTSSALENALFAKAFECDNPALGPAEKARCQQEHDSLAQRYDEELKAHLLAVEVYKEQYEKANWNATLIDLGFGRVYNYLSASLDSLDFKNAGGGIWVSGNFGIGKKALINGMVKHAGVDEAATTTFGANFRYGGFKTNFFVEGLYSMASAASLRRITIAYGGDVRFSAFAIQFGLRTDYDEAFRFRNLIPVVNFNYLLRP